MRYRPAVSATLLVLGLATGAFARQGPSVDDLVSLRRLGATAISPDGRRVAYTLRETNWKDDEFQTQIWLADVASGHNRQLTRAARSSDSPKWSPDGRWLAFASDRSGKPQLYRIDPDGGEAQALTALEDGILDFEWAPDSRTLAYTAVDPRPQAQKDRDERHGELQIADEDHRMSHLHLLDIASGMSRRLTDGPLAVDRFAWSPDGTRIAFDHRVNRELGHLYEADLSVVSVADSRVRSLVTRPGLDSRPVWSPGGSRILFVTSGGDASAYFYTTSRLAVVPAEGGAIQRLETGLDESPILVGWSRRGVFFWCFARAWAYLYRFDPESGTTERLAPATEWLGTRFSLNADATQVAFVAADRDRYPEVYAAPVATMQPKRLTRLGAQVEGWPAGTRELIRWHSRDGTPIEGVLHKPAGFRPGRRHPLLVVIHGGPASVSTAVPYAVPHETSPYPVPIWLEREALVLEPNYRGSTSYGERFRTLNIRNLGIGDAWDVISGIDSLVALGLADEQRVGVMGWSQGGYISAFLATHDSARFKAVSVGAGISDWITYYVNTDIYPFTRRYLQATPWDDPEIYAKTSPITYVRRATAPTLIQHGSADPRVPVPNAWELYVGLRDQRVPARLVLYKGLGHALTRPKANRAALEHNLEWFDRYFWGEPAPAKDRDR